MFFAGNPAYGYRLPRLTGDVGKDTARTKALCGVIDWWHHVSAATTSLNEREARLTSLLNWASMALIDARSAFNMPPNWGNRPTWGSLRTHAADRGGLTVRLLEEIAYQVLDLTSHGDASLDKLGKPEEKFIMGWAWHWAILAHAAGQVLKGNMEVAEFQERFMDEPPLRIPAEERQKFLKWVKSLKVGELDEMVKVLHLYNGWCREGIIYALENLDEVTDEQIQQAAKALWDEDFHPLSEALKEGVIDLAEILPGGES